MELQGRLAVVTGGGRGIGRGIVERFVHEGARVAVLQRRPLTPEDFPGADVVGVAADLADPGAAAAAVDKAAGLLGGIDVLVNNAGTMVERGVTQITVAEWDAMVALNLRAPLFLVQAALPHLRRRGGGSIVNIGSVEGLAANPEHAAYCATKAGLHGLTRALAVDLGPEGVRCNTIAPGWISTALSEDYLASMPDPASARARLDDLHPVGRLGEPGDVGDVAVFLASDRSSFVTGELIVVDGGRTALLPGPGR